MMNSFPCQRNGLIRPVLISTLFYMLLTGVAYPLLTTAVANVLFPWKAQGSVIEVDGKTVGSRLIAQDFTEPGYFHPRPSAVGYDAMAGYGSNLGPTNPVLIDKVAQRVEVYRATNDLPVDIRVPVDAVTASASGLDPHISIANARMQAERVASARGLPLKTVRALIDAHTIPRVMGLFGEPRINVLKINLALDALEYR